MAWGFTKGRYDFGKPMKIVEIEVKKNCHWEIMGGGFSRFCLSRIQRLGSRF
jgi:hypothetical protein